MEEAREFGARLRELRRLALLTQRRLAELIDVDFSYLSKIENGVLPPPSEKVISQMAEVLNADKDELLLLAGKVPADIAEMLKNRKTLELLRSESTRKKVSAERSGGTALLEKARNLPKIPLPAFSLNGFARVALALLLVIAVGSSLWFVSPQPAKAVDFSFPSLPSEGTLGSTYTFTVKVDISAQDVLPVQTVDMWIYKANDMSNYKATLTTLPLDDGTSKNYTTGQTGGGAAGVSASAASSWGYGTGTRKGYGYRDPEGTGWHDPLTGSGGYGYTGSGITGDTTYITFTITWTPPSDWPEGSYKVRAFVNGDNAKKFSGTSGAFTLSAPTAAVVGGAVTETAPLADVIDENGVFTDNKVIKSGDGNVEINIPRDTTGQTASGEPLSEITVVRTTPPAPPANTRTITLDYDLGPDGATFDPPISLTFTYNPSQIPEGADHENLSIAYYDADSGQWVELDAGDIEVDPATNTITARISHFTYFSVIVHSAPAEFTLSDLVISPSEVDVAEMVDISASITNTGDLGGDYKAVLKINGKTVSTKTVTLDGGASGTVTFTTVRGSAGTYTVDVNGQTGTFTVRERAPVIITAPPITIPEQPTPPAPAPTAPTVTPAPPAPTPAPVNPWLLAGIAIATIIVVGLVLWLVAFRNE